MEKPERPPSTPSAFPGLSSANRSETGSFSRQDSLALSPNRRRHYLHALLQDCSADELRFISNSIASLMKRDVLHDLPVELSLGILSYIEDPRSLVRVSAVSRHWYALARDESLWKRLCALHEYDLDEEWLPNDPSFSYYEHYKREHVTVSNWRHGGHLLRSHRVPFLPAPQPRVNPVRLMDSEHAYPTPSSPDGSSTNGQTVSDTIGDTDLPSRPSNPAIPTSVAIDNDWVVVGLANSKIYVFSARTGVLTRTLVGHTAGVWAVAIVRGAESTGKPAYYRSRRSESSNSTSDASEPGDDYNRSPVDLLSPHINFDASARYALGLPPYPRRRKPSSHNSQSSHYSPSSDGGGRLPYDPYEGLENAKRSEPSGASDGWGQPNTLIVSSGCDKVVRVWDAMSGLCLHILSGHHSTIRCLKVLHDRPIAVTGSRDHTIRLWDIQRGRLIRVLRGHEQSVRCLDVCGSIVISGSYDTTCRVWDVGEFARRSQDQQHGEEGGEPHGVQEGSLHVLRGHFHQIYTVAIDGSRAASGGLDTTVRVWNVRTGECEALLQGHTALVCHLQFTPTFLATSGSDGRVITFSLSHHYRVIQRLSAHESSVSALQLTDRFMTTAGNDGRVRLFEFKHDSGAAHLGLYGTNGPGDDSVPKCDYVRELSQLSETAWKVAFAKKTCVVVVKRAGNTVIEIWSFRPR
ncbi:WD40 repeat-like protein [Panus rudis PR-1116 ss-1]|nr:WD40 repeat-like protein [Panus rudis PR-1116 ss-1]